MTATKLLVLLFLGKHRRRRLSEIINSPSSLSGLHCTHGVRSSAGSFIDDLRVTGVAVSGRKLSGVDVDTGGLAIGLASVVRFFPAPVSLKEFLLLFKPQ